MLKIDIMEMLFVYKAIIMADIFTKARNNINMYIKNALCGIWKHSSRSYQ